MIALPFRIRKKAILNNRLSHCLLQVIYACCQASESFCTYICETETHLESLLALLMGKVCTIQYDTSVLFNGGVNVVFYV